MANTQNQQEAFLNSFFTKKEFAFLQNSNKEFKNISIWLNKEEMFRDYIVNFINNIEKQLSTEDGSPVVLELSKRIFSQININIQELVKLQEHISIISRSITDLLIAIEEDSKKGLDSNELQKQYRITLQDLKFKISNFESEYSKTKNILLENDNNINSFFKEHLKDNLNEIESLSKEKANSSFSTHIESTESTRIFEKNNNTLYISEKDNSVFLPYTESEINMYLKQYPNDYISFNQVIKKEFVLPLDYYMHHPILARFRESYSLIRDREMKTIAEAFKFAFDMMFRYELNPAIIAACKSQEQLENYLNCLENKCLENFKDFNIFYEVSPL